MRSKDEVVIIDEATVVAEEPTFIGTDESILEDAARRLRSALLALYGRRYRHAPPEDILEAFDELAAELFLPCEGELRQLLRLSRQASRPDAEAEARILAVVEESIKKLATLS